MGSEREQFEALWDRYIGAPPEVKCDRVTSLENSQKKCDQPELKVTVKNEENQRGHRVTPDSPPQRADACRTYDEDAITEHDNDPFDELKDKSLIPIPELPALPRPPEAAQLAGIRAGNQGAGRGHYGPASR